MTPEQICRDVYTETREFYENSDSTFRELVLGFRVLYGPPVVHAPVLVLGYQPGGTQAHAEAGIAEGEHDRWPERSDYAYKSWRLAVALREIWGEETMERSTGLNAIFFRAQTVDHWYKLETQRRVAAEEFCLLRAERIVRALAPQRLIVIGLGILDRLTDRSGEVAVQSDKRVLVKRGELWGVSAYGTMHLSGARISNVDRAAIRAYLSGV